HRSGCPAMRGQMTFFQGVVEVPKFQVQGPGFEIAKQIFDYLQHTPKGEATMSQLESDLKLSRQQLIRGLRCLVRTGAIEEPSIVDPTKNYRLRRRYLCGIQTSITPSVDTMSEGQKELLEKYPLVRPGERPLPPMPTTLTREWLADNEGDMKKISVLYEEKIRTLGDRCFVKTHIQNRVRRGERVLK